MYLQGSFIQDIQPAIPQSDQDIIAVFAQGPYPIARKGIVFFQRNRGKNLDFVAVVPIQSVFGADPEKPLAVLQ